MNMIPSIRVFQILLIQFLVEHVQSGAIFEVDLLRYEALPNKCCDGYRSIPFGPLKCNECDPYFTICLKQLPSGSRHCVTTTRENNINSYDLSRGNILPNHLSTSMDNWQGSLLVDVDIKDFDSTTKDDDIDHLLYTYTGTPSPSSKVVVVNGTKVGLTMEFRVYCQPNYYGNDCATNCLNDTRSFCDTTGNKVCISGYGGAGCTEIVAIVTTDAAHPDITDQKTSTFTVRPSPVKQSTEPAHEISVSHHDGASTNVPTVHTNTDYHYTKVDGTTVATGTTVKTETSTQNSSKERINDFTVAKHENDKITETSSSHYEVVSTTSDAVSTEIEQYNSVETTITSQTNMKKSTTSDVTSNMTTQAYATESSPSSSQNATHSDKHTSHSPEYTSQVPDVMTGSSSIPSMPFIPEPIELYSCNIVIDGHKAGVRDAVVSVVTLALTTVDMFHPSEMLMVSGISSTFELTDTGNDITDITYIVQYNGRVLQRIEVTQLLTSPEVTTTIDSKLTAKNLTQYKSSQKMESLHSKDQSWVQVHLPFVVVMACVASLLLLVPIIIFARRLRLSTSNGKTKKEQFSMKNDYKLSNSVPFDTAYSIENPLYDYETNGIANSNSFA